MYTVYSRTDGAFRGSGVMRYENADVGSTEVPYPAADEDSPPLFWDGTQWGNTPAAHEPPVEIWPKPVIPASVSALQGMLAISRSGLVPAFMAWKATLDPVVDFAVIAFFDKAPTWNRDNSYLIQSATALGLTSEQLDGLFTLAATL